MKVDIVEEYKLPTKVQVRIQRTPEGGFYATFPTLPGCRTQANTIVELNENITDAILTYFDVPKEEISNDFIYVPEARDLKPIELTTVASATTRAKFELYHAY